MDAALKGSATFGTRRGYGRIEFAKTHRASRDSSLRSE